MRKIKVLVTVGFVVVCVVFSGYFVYKEKNRDKKPPVITFAQEKIVVPLNTTMEELLQGVTASDNRDGDVSDTLMVEELTSMVEHGVCVANYIAFDEQKNITKRKRLVEFEGYKAPQFKISKPLVVTTTKLSDILDQVEVEDSLGQELNERVKLIELESNENSNYRNCELEVSNYLGDTSKLPIVVEQKDAIRVNQELSLLLTNYVTYLKVGEKVDYTKFIGGVKLLNRTYGFDNNLSVQERKDIAIDQKDVLPVSEVQIEDKVDYETPGNYTVDFMYTNQDGLTAMTTLYVVVYS